MIERVVGCVCGRDFFNLFFIFFRFAELLN